jgi:hypothetical protein
MELDNSKVNILYVWPGEWGLFSVDPECNIAMVTCNFYLNNILFMLIYMCVFKVRHQDFSVKM